MLGARGADVLRYFKPLATRQIGRNRHFRRAAKGGKKYGPCLIEKMNIMYGFVLSNML
ncbi:hypothetical protein DBT_2357 [Dissulfuribacter thermophilus]|uniref:Uncharacterized protein n=1 Tax=Dissulfuribacter thermophilus TaxID=1156395 RepID=A0A1B9F321_9BACT|nr:hypothetical protein DBT_2357 [Dissulfuribacter thermophilus]